MTGLPRPTRPDLLVAGDREPDAEDWRQRLRAHGHRLTPQRQLVLRAVSELEHATPEDIHARVRAVADSVSLSTVYRALELLEGLGLVAHTHLGPGAPRYHQASHAGHLHLVCRGCGQVTAVAAGLADGLVERLRTGHGFEPDVGHLSLFGRCQDCASTQPTPDP